MAMLCGDMNIVSFGFTLSQRPANRAASIQRNTP